MDINQIKQLKKDIESGKQKTLELDDEFQFKCTACGKCCFNINVLTNCYDIIRLRNALKMSTKDILQKDFLSFHIGQSSGLPVCEINFVELNKNVSKCPFLMPAVNADSIHKGLEKQMRKAKNEKERKQIMVDFQKDLKDFYEGKRSDVKIEKWLCSVHKHRPLVCRFYPCGRIKEINKKGKKKTHWILQEPVKWCPGFKSAKKITLRQFLKESEFYHYDEGSAKYESIMKRLITSGLFVPTKDNKNDATNPPKLQSNSKLFMIIANILYNFDSFNYFSEDDRVLKTINDPKATHKDFMYVFNKIESMIRFLEKLFKQYNDDNQIINYLYQKGGENKNGKNQKS